MAISSIQVERTTAAIPQWCVPILRMKLSCQLLTVLLVKGIYLSWSNNPPNPKIKDWNVTELKVGLRLGIALFFFVITSLLDRPP